MKNITGLQTCSVHGACFTFMRPIMVQVCFKLGLYAHGVHASRALWATMFLPAQELGHCHLIQTADN